MLLALPIFLQACKYEPQHRPPKVERCIVSIEEQGNSCICINLNISPDPVILPIEHCNNYIAISPANYGLIEQFYDKIVSELERCEASANESCP